MKLKAGYVQIMILVSSSSSAAEMGPERKLDVPVYDLSLIRGMWEVRVKKHRERQKKEKERIEQSALTR